MDDAVQKRDVQVKVRMSFAERESLRRISAQLGLTLSELVRRSFRAYGADLLNRRRRCAASKEIT